MPNIIIAYDEKDYPLGEFFKSCKEHLVNFLATKSFSVSAELGSDRLNDLAVSMIIEDLESFIFSAYSHGDKSSLLKAGASEYVSVQKNGLAFKGGFVYTFSCSSGLELGRDLISCNCHCFIGYNRTVYIWTNHVPTFVECVNHGLIAFFNGATSSNVINQMIEKYNEEIDRMSEIDAVVAADLVSNRRALVMHGKDIGLVDL